MHLQNKAMKPISWIADKAYSYNETELLALFMEAFGHEMSPELWHWKYQSLENLGSLINYNGRIIAFYGGMPREIHLFGSPSKALQIGDVMVHPKSQIGLARKGLFFKVATHFLDHFVGKNKCFPIAFGFPTAKAFRLGEQLGLYVKVGEMMQISWTAIKSRPSYRIKLRPLHHDKDVETVNLLWQKMANALQDQIIGVRDWSYLQHRYLKHPNFSYKLYLISSRLTGIPIGIIVVRVLDDTLEMLDIIAPPQQIATLIHCLRRLTWSIGKEKAYCWITNQHVQLFASNTGEITATGIVIPHNRWTLGIAYNELVDRWWLMSGDTDFR